MKWGYRVGASGQPLAPIFLKEDTHCHALITGSSGSGKSYALQILLGNILQSSPSTIIYLCDFKNSKDFEYLNGYPYYYAGDRAYEGIMDYYKLFTMARKKGTSKRRFLLVVDEYPALVSYLTNIDKAEKSKKANEILSCIAEILMLGRGIGFGVWIICQRSDSELFSKGARDNFMVVLGLGRLSKESKNMIFAGEEIPDRVFGRGEGMLLADGKEIMQVCFFRIKNMVEWKRHIKLALMRNRISG